MASFDILSGRSKPGGGIFVECDDTAFETVQNQLAIKNSYFVDALQKNTVNASYAPYYVQSSAPSSPYHGWLWYDTDDNKLYQYNVYKSDWIELDWVTAIKATPEWQAGKLQIASGVLQITPNSGTNWYDCYPMVGAKAYSINDYSKKYFMQIGETVLINNTSIPIVFAIEMNNIFRYAGYEVGFLVLSNISNTVTYYDQSNTNSSHAGGNATYSSYRLGTAGGTAQSATTGVIIIRPNYCYITEHEWYYPSMYGTQQGSCYGSISSSCYWLGTRGSSNSTIVVTKEGCL